MLFRSLALLAPLSLVFTAMACSSGGESTSTSAGGAGGSGGASSASSSASSGGSSASSSTSSSSGSSSSSTSSSSSSGSGTNSGDCATDADCPGSSCVEITPGGFRVCLKPVAPVANGCQPACSSGKTCYPPFNYCGGFVGPMNQCLSDMCTGDSDCGSGQICILAGVVGYPVNACAIAACKHDTDCTAKPGGKCAPVEDACCTVTQGLYCVYPNGGCRKNSDCPGGYCESDPNTGTATCKPGQAPCPV